MSLVNRRFRCWRHKRTGRFYDYLIFKHLYKDIHLSKIIRPMNYRVYDSLKPNLRRVFRACYEPSIASKAREVSYLRFYKLFSFRQLNWQWAVKCPVRDGVHASAKALFNAVISKHANVCSRHHLPSRLLKKASA
jgi:hypothetical protein